MMSPAVASMWLVFTEYDTGNPLSINMTRANTIEPHPENPALTVIDGHNVCVSFYRLTINVPTIPPEPGWQPEPTPQPAPEHQDPES